MMNGYKADAADRLLTAYDYDLPEGLIAQNPVVPRDTSRLLVVKSPTDYSHHIFRELPNFLRSGDLLVLNDTRVIPARLYGYKASGAAIEVLLLEKQAPHRWVALVKPGRRLKLGAEILFGEPVHARPMSEAIQPLLRAMVVAVDDATGGRILEFDLPPEQSLEDHLERLGQMPLPPYITQSQASSEQYQTVYAEKPGSAAAPTAGLHFTPELLERLQHQGIDRAIITLHVGVGTFRPVETADITDHKMHSEWVEVSPETVERVRRTKARGGRVIAVGTTATRSLEGAAQSGELCPLSGKVDLFIYPGYQWQVVDGLVTNFHLPCSSLLMLVSALIGRQRLLDLYREAIDHQYRFFSFGDAMLILPEARQG
ncbi:tRNA preQ1(34) S-adenosylmethionine ribosyltransferase-isomerase QueA [Leptolyngbya sp. 'hensonii']|uniref:tRNA preQ1(34) S-adenosylmethionine ribosyltransferase-isomerase QueA n=1 Tax=Leptolyngbya sp. 'hensonii' TaxID=1922337 RepID=UPI00094F4B8E|nr:tRNA preQ1(34) S-adenosylmethionine ribosyltransferase-isomerase QueA [Leptolyngbya sp. 'hensonii']OLP16296.1 tRNA preQ1(34) S-adenosylmethionine ribosyltransferase-isomerase QueA [Leptolyngbya sp. 'hensonii']